MTFFLLLCMLYEMSGGRRTGVDLSAPHVQMKYAPVMELVDMRDLGSYVSNSTTLPLKNPLSIDIARFFSGPFVLDFGGYFGVLSSVLSCHLVYPYGHLFPDVL